MTYLAERLLVRLLVARWSIARSVTFKKDCQRWLNEILNDEEFYSDGRQAVLTRASTEEKQRVLKHTYTKIKMELDV